jgi:chromosomal replication initiator protein
MTELWGQVVSSIEEKVAPAQRDSLLRPIELISMEGETVRLRVPNRYQKEWFEDNYVGVVVDELKARTGLTYRVEFELTEQESAQLALPESTLMSGGSVASGSSTPTRSPFRAPVVAPAPSLQERYTFEQFVVGPTNRFAHSAAQMVAELPGQRWNPLFIYGGSGVGKTHLLHAIGHEIYRAHPDWKIVFITCEKFVTDFIGSIMNQNRGGGVNLMEEFRKRYRESADVLLIDDIQFLSNKDSSQDEFFHTFNALHHAHKQIVMTCDKLPAEVSGLEDRLRSRFTWGLIAEMGLPDLETRVAILKRKAERENVVLPDDVAMYIGGAVKTSVRDLEGALARLIARSSFEHQEVSLALAKEALKNFLPETPIGLTIEAVQREVANYFNVKLADLKGPKRHRAISHPRAIAMFLSRQLTTMSYPEIGHRFGGKDHSTVITAVRKIDRLIKEDPAQRSIVKTIESHLLDS